MKKLLFTLTLVICLGGASAIRAQQLPQALTNRLQTVLDSICDKHHIKGASAAMLIPNAGTWKGTYGESHGGVPISPDMLLGMGSNTKTHISALLLKMQENHLISLDDTIGQWIKGYPNINGQITIRQMLNHTSGIFDYLHNSAVNDSIFGNPWKIWQPEEILWLAKAPSFAPGTSWEYSNTNYIAAGIIISKVLNKPVAQAMHEMILSPNGLNNTIFYEEPTTAVVPHPWSTCLTGKYMTDLTEEPVPLVANLFSLAGTAGSMVTTAEDNVRFWHKLITGQILNSASMNEMLNYISISGVGVVKTGYGLGIFRYRNYINQHTIYTHGGTFYGFVNENMVDSVNGTTIAVLTNQDSITNSILLTRVLTSLHKVSLQMPVTGIHEARYNNPAVQLYPNPASDVLHVNTEAYSSGSLFMLYDLTGKVQLTQKMESSRSSFSTANLPAGLYIACVKDTNGQVLTTQKIQLVK